jgi:glycerol-3-phosphate dehydrogenase (NAD(P)+)
LKSLPDISKWDTKNVTNMSNMFLYCLELTSLPDLTKWYIGDNTDIKDIFETDYFHLTYTDDSIGMELGAALKNIISLGSGIVEGLGYESNTLSYFITEGLREIKEISLKMGAKLETIYGLAGLGDLLTTSLSLDSRNKRCGLLLAKNKNLDEIKEEIGMTIEGLDSLNSGYLLAKKYNVDAKIIFNLYDIIYNNRDVKTILD